MSERTYARSGTLGGTRGRLPWLTGAFLFAVFSSVGLPGLNNFVGEFLVMLGTFTVNGVRCAIAIAVILAAIYMLWSYQRTAYGPIHEERWLLPDLILREVRDPGADPGAMLVFGVFPRSVTDRIVPPRKQVVENVRITSGRRAGDVSMPKRTGPAVIPTPRSTSSRSSLSIFLRRGVHRPALRVRSPGRSVQWPVALARRSDRGRACHVPAIWHWDGPSTVMRGMVR